MLAILAAAIFALALILDWANVKASDAFTPQTLMFLGLLCLALHLAGVGATTSWRGRRRRL
jgi:Na+/phosphate symporter